MWVMGNFELLGDDAPRPDLANMPSLGELISLYEKVLSELDSAISTQKEFAKETPKSDLPRDWANNIIDK